MKVSVIGLLLSLAALSNAQDWAGKSLPDPHHHVALVEQWEVDLAKTVRLLPLSTPVQEGRDSVLSPKGRWLAFLISVEDESARVCLEDKRVGKCYQVVGLPLPYRPIDDLVWIDTTLIAFDRWSQPHYGVHYVLDVQKRQLFSQLLFQTNSFFGNTVTLFAELARWHLTGR